MKNILNKLVITVMMVALMFTGVPMAFADAVSGDKIVVLGEDLTPEQREDTLDEMGVEDETEVQIVEVTNEDEHKYLGEHIPKAQIGTNAISSAVIVMGEDGDGLSIQTENINYVTEKMYGNALSTAGVKDAKIYITAPFDVSGTGALTGIMQAYEITSGEEIDEDKKEVANEEMVVTSDLSENDTMDEDEAADFITLIKEKVSKEEPQSKEDVKALIEEVADEEGYELTKEDTEKTVNLFVKFKDLNIDWDAVNQKVDDVKGKVTDFIDSDEGQNIFNSVKNFFVNIWNAMVDLVKSITGGSETE